MMFRAARSADANRCFAIETSAYSRDEAATLGKIEKRISEYPDGFLVLEVGGKIVGFINSGCAFEVDMADEAFKDLTGHDPSAPNVVILSVVIDPAEQGKGFAAAMMSEFVGRMAERGKTALHLMCKDQYVHLYDRLGFRYLQESASTHGGQVWHEMVMDL